MSVSEVIARIAALQGAADMLSGAAPPVTSVPSSSTSSFRTQLLRAQGAAGSQAITAPQPAGTSVAQRMVGLAQAELAKNVHETPAGSNRSPDITRYETATAGAIAGQPWCAYFASYIAREAGVPLGDSGQGYGRVNDIQSWAQRTGRMRPSGQSPEPGDLMLFPDGAHVGIVESVNPDGTLTTIEGNESDAVKEVQHRVNEAAGYVRLG